MTRSNKTALQMLAGGLFGAIVGPALVRLVVYLGLPTDRSALSAGGVVLAAVGALYGLMGLFVLIGVIWPRLGALLLNVADEEDLLDRREMLYGAALSCLLLGGAMMVLPFSGGVMPVSPGVAMVVVALALVLTLAISWVSVRRKHYDELWSHLTAQASVITLSMLAALMVGWGAMAHLGWASPLDPLLFVAAPPGFFLLASIIVVGRKGMLMAQ